MAQPRLRLARPSAFIPIFRGVCFARIPRQPRSPTADRIAPPVPAAWTQPPVWTDSRPFRRETTFAVACHGMGSHRQDRDVAASACFLSRISAVASNPPISGICTSMRTRSKICSSSICRAALPFSAMATRARLFPESAGRRADLRHCLRPEECGSQLLGLRLGSRRCRGDCRPAAAAGLRAAMAADNSRPQFGTPHGFGEIGRNTQLPATRQIVARSPEVSIRITGCANSGVS